ncbi:MAG: hypothetical protein A3F11_01905 [Gammaproteobacteria bacterium RIFCSPHIGHO2_12_FULL_37_14]|nr:MAG: hypothetical protein A3F11_01905 [Gammaproteobacteria bacterium RIFCSPHIGHO2_12_FULL_37_14]
MRIRVNLISSADIQSFIELIAVTRLHEFYAANQTYNTLIDFIKNEQQGDPKRKVFGIYLDNRLIGFEDILDFDANKRSAYVNGLMIHPDESRHGYGTILFLHVIEKLNLRSMKLSSFDDDCATSFYISFGFYPEKLGGGLQSWMKECLKVKMRSIPDDGYKGEYHLGKLLFNFDFSYCCYFFRNKIQEFSKKHPEVYQTNIKPFAFLNTLTNDDQEKIGIQQSSKEIIIQIGDIKDREYSYNSDSESESDEVATVKDNSPYAANQNSQVLLFNNKRPLENETENTSCKKHQSNSESDDENKQLNSLSEADIADWLSCYHP